MIFIRSVCIYIVYLEENVLFKLLSNELINPLIPIFIMKVNIQSIDFNASASLVQFTETKLNKLENFYDRIISANVHLKLTNTTSKENKSAEISLSIPGNDLIVKKTAKSFEEAVDECVSSLKRQVEKHKSKRSLHAV